VPPLDDPLAEADAHERAGHVRVARSLYQRALDARRGEALLGLARLAICQANWPEADRCAEAALELAERDAKADDAALALNVRAAVRLQTGAYAEATELLRAALGRAETPRTRGVLYGQLANIAALSSRFAESAELYDRAAGEFEAAGYDLGLAQTLASRAALALDRGDPALALSIAEVAAVAGRAAKAEDVVMVARENAAQALLMLGRGQEAERDLVTALGHFHENPVRQAEVLEILGQVYAAQPDHRDTARKCLERALEAARRAGVGVIADRIAARLAGA
jgi:tetratricopeptide (TPR) repeat protein